MGSKKKASAQGDSVRNGTKSHHNGNVKSANNGNRKGGGSSDESNHSEGKMVDKKVKRLKPDGKIRQTSNNTSSAICTFLVIFLSILIVTVAIVFSNPNLRKKLGQVINEYSNYQSSILDIDKNQTTVTEAKKNSKTVNQNDHINIQKNGKKFNEKTNKISETIADVNDYEKQDITNKDDFKIKEKLDEADVIYYKEEYEKAKKKYEKILDQHQNSPRALFGLANCLDKLAEKQRSNALLQDSISTLDKVVRKSTTPDRLVFIAGEQLVKLLRFRGWTPKAIEVSKYMVQRFPTNHTWKNTVGVNLLVAGKNPDAKIYFEQVLETHPDNGFAKSHMGFILKHESKYEEAVKYLSEGIASKEPGAVDGRFYFALGDAHFRIGQPEKARKVYEEAAELKMFASADQRSLYNLPNLTARPFWTPEQLGYRDSIQLLKDNWKIIRDEGLANLNPELGTFKDEAENLREAGDWKQFTLFKQGRKLEANCLKAPKTCALLEKIPDATTNKRGQIKYSVMHPGVHVWPHCGPTNCRLRAHVGLVVPQGPRIRVVNETRTWREGEVMIFDDSFEHEVWHEGETFRLVLIVDFWHPEITPKQRRSLKAV